MKKLEDKITTTISQRVVQNNNSIFLNTLVTNAVSR